MKIIKLAGILATALLLGGSFAQAQDKPEKPDIVLGVGGKSSLYYLPLTLTERLGYFKEQGLNVSITDFGGGSKSLQSLIGGSADVVTGAYEHTIRMQTKGQDITAVIELGRYPGMVLAVRKEQGSAGQIVRRPQGHEDRRHRAGLVDQFLCQRDAGARRRQTRSGVDYRRRRRACPRLRRSRRARSTRSAMSIPS